MADGARAAALDEFLGALSRSGGVVRRDVAIALIGRRGLDRLLRDGRVARLLAGIYVHRGHLDDHEARCRAVVVWARGAAVIAGESALHLLDARFPAPRVVAASAPTTHRPFAMPWAEVTLTRMPDRRRMVRRIPVMAPADAVVDAWCRAQTGARAGVLYEALWRGICTTDAIDRAAAARHRVAQRQVLARILRDFRAGATSPTEVMAKRDVFRGAAFADLEWQVDLDVRGRRRHADALHRAARVVIELDGDAYHSTREQREADRERDADLAHAGWQTVRLGFRDLRDRPRWCRETITGIIAHRLAHAPSSQSRR
ncbi:DUF559 domain-containing protein [Demequina mangrovi]|uniref:DUF559 domain-containing protein n=1 Tax=Demequina mangrovi TaxID=1043493 RepID=A0A1H6VY60_9MICO|nr:DUF559 domain-containing protein [Demequina mangrovi]SEJ09628.1 Protein of unknown function [Demequina mangrovi]